MSMIDSPLLSNNNGGTELGRDICWHALPFYDIISFGDISLPLLSVIQLEQLERLRSESYRADMWCETDGATDRHTPQQLRCIIINRLFFTTEIVFSLFYHNTVVLWRHMAA